MHGMGFLKSNFKVSFCNFNKNIDSEKSPFHFFIYIRRNIKPNRFKNDRLNILHNLIMFDKVFDNSSKPEYLEKGLIKIMPAKIPRIIMIVKNENKERSSRNKAFNKIGLMYK